MPADTAPKDPDFHRPDQTIALSSMRASNAIVDEGEAAALGALAASLESLEEAGRRLRVATLKHPVVLPYVQARAGLLALVSKVAEHGFTRVGIELCDLHRIEREAGR